MTEAEWLSCADPERMYCQRMRRGNGYRKYWLFNVACCRRVWDLLLDERSRRAVEGLESSADNRKCGGWLPDQIYKEAVDAAHSLRTRTPVRYVYAVKAVINATNLWQLDEYPDSAASAAADAVYWTARRDRATLRRAERAAQASLYRDIYGNPFRPAPRVSGWLTATVVQLARGIYAERSFDDLPVLADALEEAGCTDAEILGHCRGPGPHARGCWVVDALLGKK